MTADGLSLDDKRQPVQENDIPDLLQKWHTRVAPSIPVKDASYNGLPLLEQEGETPKTQRSGKAFFVPKDEIQTNGYDLSINRYKEVEYEEVQYEPPKVILQKLRALEDEIKADLDALENLLS
jgi:type I restriction enzyme M protein